MLGSVSILETRKSRTGGDAEAIVSELDDFCFVLIGSSQKSG
tara:strand:- start:46 stop:171 length:126 start_codon:yes stop_codon:yes gene_type:complete